MSKQIQILLADDHPLIRAGIRAILTTEPDLILIGEAANGYEAQQLSYRLKPDVLLLDLKMPGPSPAETVGYLQTHCPEVKVIVLTAYDDEDYVRLLLLEGVAGYILKEEAARVVVRAVHEVMQGNRWFSRSIVNRLARMEPAGPEPGLRTGLTETERNLLSLLAQGRSDAEIARELNLGEQTIRNYNSQLYAKLGARTRSEAIYRAKAQGLL